MTFATICSVADDWLFEQLICKSWHLLHSLLPPNANNIWDNDLTITCFLSTPQLLKIVTFYDDLVQLELIFISSFISHLLYFISNLSVPFTTDDEEDDRSMSHSLMMHDSALLICKKKLCWNGRISWCQRWLTEVEIKSRHHLNDWY